MKGLIRNNFYSMESNLKISFVLALLLYVASLFVKDNGFITMIISMQTLVFTVNIGTALHTDVISKWNKFERTLPVKFSDIIRAKYISFLILFLAGIIMGSCTGLSSYVVGSFSNIQPIFIGYTYGLTLAVTAAGIMYPLMLKIGTDKNEMILILSIMAGLGLIVLVAAILAPITGEMNMRHPITQGVSTIVAFMIFAVSYFVSIVIYKTKEFS